MARNIKIYKTKRKKGEARPRRRKGASFGVGEHTSAACRPHLAADSPLSAVCL